MDFHFEYDYWGIKVTNGSYGTVYGRKGISTSVSLFRTDIAQVLKYPGELRARASELLYDARNSLLERKVRKYGKNAANCIVNASTQCARDHDEKVRIVKAVADLPTKVRNCDKLFNTANLENDPQFELVGVTERRYPVMGKGSFPYDEMISCIARCVRETGDYHLESGQLYSVDQAVKMPNRVSGKVLIGKVSWFENTRWNRKYLRWVNRAKRKNGKPELTGVLYAYIMPGKKRTA